MNELILSVQGYLLLIANQELDSGLRAKLGASDLVQSALVLAEQNLDQFRGSSRETLLAWLRKILRNEICAAHRRYVQAQKRNTNREVTATTDSRYAPPVADDCPSPRTEAVLNEEAQALRCALKQLPADYRMVVVLRNWERLPFDQIGRRMNRSTEAVKKLWARAVRKLKEELTSESARELT